MEIEWQHEDDVDFSKYHTWDWIADSSTPPTDPRLDDPVVKARIRGAIETQLLEQGFQKNSGSADFIVHYHAALQDNLSQTTVDDAYDNATYAEHTRNWDFQYTHEWLEGTLLIDILDSSTNELVWRGSAQAELSLTATDEERDKRVKEAVKKMLKNFPPK
jgi:hypothetical protein